MPADRIAWVASAAAVYTAVMIVPHLGRLLVAPMDAGVTLLSGCLVGFLASQGGSSAEVLEPAAPGPGPDAPTSSG